MEKRLSLEDQLALVGQPQHIVEAFRRARKIVQHKGPGVVRTIWANVIEPGKPFCIIAREHEEPRGFAFCGSIRCNRPIELDRSLP